MAGHEKRDIGGNWAGSYAWLSGREHTDTAVIFVHGFFGDARGTWTDFPGLLDDYAGSASFWPRADLFFLDYPSYQHHVVDNADRLLDFIDSIFPKPPSSLFKPVQLHPVSSELTELVLRWKKLEPRTYKQLCLVGHSEGALIIRQAMIDVCQRSNGESPILDARLELFGPAHRGVLLTGWVQAVLLVASAERLTLSALETLPAFKEMQDPEFISGIQESTISLLAEYGSVALRARVLFGCKENLVRVQVFPKDIREKCASDRDHVSVCKPNGGYLRPFEFIERILD